LDAAFHEQRFAASGNVTWTRGVIDEYTDDATGQTFRHVEPLLTPTIVTNQRVSFGVFRGAWVHLDGRYVGESFLANTADSRFMLPAAFTFDAALAYEIGEHALLLQLRNVTDRRTYTSGYTDGTTRYFYVLAGRNLIATLRLGL
jgi:hypothetical protein